MKRNEMPIDLTGFAEYGLKIISLYERLEEIETAELTHWLKVLPPPYVNVRKQIRLKIIKLKAA